MAQISASVNKPLIEEIKDIQKKENQTSFSQMIETLLMEAVNNRKKGNKK